jgi:hypothetical protein
MLNRTGSRDRKEHSERTDELTGADATMDEADIGSAGNGADPYGGDLTGGLPAPIEAEPEAEDLLPDQIARFPEGVTPEASEEERELTAQPDERMPIEPSDFP